MSDTKSHRSKKFMSKFVVLNEEELIRFVESRPILYDKSLKGYRKTNIRQQVWRELAMEMGDFPVEECRKRWRSLRDSFTKHYKMSLRLEPDERSKKKKWVFYDRMSFLAPYLDKSSCDTDRALLDCFGDNSNSNDSESEIRTTFLKPSDSLFEESSNQDQENYSIASLNEDTKSHEKIEDIRVVQTINDTKETEDLNHFSTLSEINYEVNETRHSTHSCENFSTDNSNHVGRCCANNEIAVQVSSSNYDELYSHSCSDPDEKFLLSCLPAFKRLSHQQNALARLRIQKILYEIEFGTVDEMP